MQKKKNANSHCWQVSVEGGEEEKNNDIKNLR